MNLKNCNQLLQEYKKQLNEISINDADYKISISVMASNFFNEIDGIDKNFLVSYFNNINEVNFIENKVQKDAFNYLFLLIIKNKNNAEILNKFFPAYIESQSITYSNWRLIRWLQIFVFWLSKPKIKLNNFPDAINLLNALRDVKHRIKNSKSYLLDVDLEMEKYKSLTFIIEKFLENKTLPLIYTPIDESYLLRERESFYKKQLSILNTSDLNRAYSDIDALLKYLKIRIKQLANLDIKVRLSKEFTLLKYLVFNNEFSLFEKKIFEIKGFINKKTIGKDIGKIRGIFNLINGVQRRLEFLSRWNIEKENLVEKNKNFLTPEFKLLLNLKLNEIKFYYENIRGNLDKQTELCYGNFNDYEIFNKLEEILYMNKNLFFHSINLACNADYENLSIIFDKLQILAKELEAIAKKLDPKALENDIHKLSQFISTEISNIQTEFNKENIEISYSCRNTSDEEIEICEEDEGWDTEWETGSDISELTSSDLTEREEGEDQSNIVHSDHVLTIQSTTEVKQDTEESDSAYSEEDDQSDTDLNHVFPQSSTRSFSEQNRDDRQSKINSKVLHSSTLPVFFGKREAVDSYRQLIQDTLSIVKPT